ncbi:MAG TPA: hypothetical protein VGR24_11630, partial [bacterium]|nr:hypothetical protein [bacterium]
SIEADILPRLIIERGLFAYDNGMSMFLHFGDPRGLTELTRLEHEVVGFYRPALLRVLGNQP